MPPRSAKGALAIFLVGATASFLDKFASREEFAVGELRKIRHERDNLSGHGLHDRCKGRARRDDVAAAARTYLPETWPSVPTGRVSVFVQVFDRVRATGKDLPNLGKDTDHTENFIEARNQRGELDTALTYASIVADLEVLGSCDAIVGTAASWVSRLIFLLIIGSTGRTPPHVFLDQRFGGPADVW